MKPSSHPMAMGNVQPKITRVLMTADTLGGVWAYSLDLAQGLGDYGIGVILVSTGEKPNEHQRRQVRQLENVTLIETNFKLEWMEDPWRDVRAAGEFLLGIEHGFTPDIIHLNDYCHAALPFKSPVLVVGHSCVFSWYDAVHHSLPPEKWDTYHRRVSLGLQSADMVTAPTQVMINALQSIYGSFRASAAIPNGRNFKAVVTKKEPFVFSAGRLWDEAKNIKCIHAGAKKIKWPVFIAGQNKHPNGKRVNFEHVQSVGLLNADEMAKYMSRASIFALPAKYEPFGLCMLEAALCGCALVIGDIPSLREVWQDSAVYVEPDDVNHLTKEINTLIEQPELLNDYSHKAQKHAQKFTVKRMSQAYVKLYNNMMAEKAETSKVKPVAIHT